MTTVSRNFCKPIKSPINRYFSSHKRILNVVKTGILEEIFQDVSIFKQKAFVERISALNKLNITIKETNLSDHHNMDELQSDSKYFAGDFTQYPSIAHKNTSKFQNEYLRLLTPKTYWTTSNQTKRALGLEITSTVDYHPFPMTTNHQNTKWKKKKHNYDFRDSIGSKIPLLNRTINNTQQHLLLWRDRHDDETSSGKMEKLIYDFHPDTIILETSGQANCFAESANIQSKKYTSSVAINSAIKSAHELGIHLVLSDLPDTMKKMLSTGANVLDIYALQCLWYFLGLPQLHVEELSFKIPHKFLHFLCTKIAPHFLMQSSYRNDAMALTINESTEKKIVFIGGAFHIQDIVDRLCGNVEMRNPFSVIDDRRVGLKPLIPHHYAGHSKFDITDKEVAKVIKVLGQDAYELLTGSNDELSERLRNKIGNNV